MKSKVFFAMFVVVAIVAGACLAAAPVQAGAGSFDAPIRPKIICADKGNFCVRVEEVSLNSETGRLETSDGRWFKDPSVKAWIQEEDPYNTATIHRDRQDDWTLLMSRGTIVEICGAGSCVRRQVAFKGIHRAEDGKARAYEEMRAGTIDTIVDTCNTPDTIMIIRLVKVGQAADYTYTGDDLIMEWY